MANPFFGRDILSISDFSKADLQYIVNQTLALKQNGTEPWLQNRLIASCFFEASTRTRLSFEAAVQRLGGNLIGFTDAEHTSAKKGESLSDSIRMIASYADAIIMRHPQEGSARLAAEVAGVPVINCGDGANQHPTQTLLDLFSIAECQGRLEGLSIALVGDLKYGRTVHSLVQALSHFEPTFYFAAPEALAMPQYITEALTQAGVRFEVVEHLETLIPLVDVLYMTRVQQERFDPTEYMHLAARYLLVPDMLKFAQPHMRIMHPLPRLDEIHHRIDLTDHAYYLQQAENGLYTRQALLALILNEQVNR